MTSSLVPFNASATGQMVEYAFALILDLKYYFIAIFGVFFALFVLDIIIPFLLNRDKK